jgi:prophage regulatory protein
MAMECADRVSPRRMLRLKEVIERTGLGKTTIYQMQRMAKFPHSVMMTSRSVRWIEAEIETWLEQRAGSRKSREIQP